MARALNWEKARRGRSRRTEVPTGHPPKPKPAMVTSERQARYLKARQRELKARALGAMGHGS